jgi:hypothetical protein
VGNPITATPGTYAANDGGPAGTHTYKWFRANNSGGTGESVISGSVARTYTPVAADFGKWICIETTPVGNGSLTGTPVRSAYIQIGVKITASATGAGGASAITVGGAAGATGKVFYDATPIGIAVTKNTATDAVAWTASGGGSFGNASSESTTYTPPASPAGNIALTATLTAENPTGIEDILSETLQIYPNPAKDELYIKSELPVVKIEIMDFAGRIVETLRATSLQDSTTIINVSALPQGVYMLKVYTGSGVTIKKVVKE